MTRLRVFAAGSGANFLVAALVLVLVSFVLWPAVTGPGIELIHVNESSPAEIAGLKPDMILTSVNGHEITTNYNEYLSGRGYLREELGTVQANETLVFATEDGTYDVKMSSVNGNLYMGIIYKPVYNIDGMFFFGTLLPLLTMIWIFSFAVGVFNILPLYPLDGGLMLEAITDNFMKKRSKAIVKTVSLMILLIILYNFFGPSIV